MSRGGPYKIRQVTPKNPDKQFQISVPRDLALQIPKGTFFEVELAPDGKLVYTPVMRLGGAARVSRGSGT